MPKYTINGVTFNSDQELTPQDLEALAAQTSTQKPPQPEATAQQPVRKETAGEGFLRGTGLAARAGITGLAALPAMLADVPVATGNIVSSLFGGGTMQLPSQALQQTLTAAGLPEPQTGLEKALMAGTEAATGTGALAQAAKTTGSQLLAPLTQRLGTQMAASGAAGAAAQPVAEVVSEQSQNPYAGLIAGLATGMAAGTLGAKGVQLAGRVGEAKLPTLTEIKKNAQAKYGEMSAQGITLKPQSVLDFVSKTETELGKLNLNPKLDTHKPVATVLEDWKDMVGQQRVPFDKLEQMRSKMNDLRAPGEPDATRKLAGAAVAQMDAYMASLTGKDIVATAGQLDKAIAAVQSARKDWRNLSRASVLEDALDVAEAKALDPKASEGELIRRQLINLAANKDKMAMFSEREQNAIRSVAKGGMADPLLSLVARFNPERSQITTGLTLAGATASPIAAASTAGAGFLSDRALSAMRRADIERLIRQMGAGRLPAEDINTLYARMFGASQGANQ